MIVNPYANINFGTYREVQSFTHGHVKTVDAVNKLINSGATHWPISNYRPSDPVYNLEYLGLTVPDGIIIGQNAEHWQSKVNGTYMSNFHFCSIGSRFKSGTAPDPEVVGDKGKGCRMAWQQAFDGIINELVYEDGGGIVINHPQWSRAHSAAVDVPFMCDKLDYDSRVLGIEVINGSNLINKDADYTYCLPDWDGILLTGRRCWGFGAPDWAHTSGAYRGFNRLFVPAFTDHDCMKAYRNGEFYISDSNESPHLTGISVTGSESTGWTYSVQSDASRVRVVVDGESTDFESSSANVQIPNDFKYVRAELYGNGEYKVSFTQPVMRVVEPEPIRVKKNTTDYFFFF